MQLDKTHKTIARMFDSIADRYDFTNTVLSFGIHYLWKKKLVNLVSKQHSGRALDIATGTGDIAKLLLKKGFEVAAVDISTKMLEIAKLKHCNISFLEAAAENLPFADNSFDVVTISYGVRNFQDRPAAFQEILRVLKPGGRIGILEFGARNSGGVFNLVYSIYSDKVLPFIGGLLTKNKTAYEYLDKSSREFPAAAEFCREMELAGFRGVSYVRLFFGVCYIYTGIK